MIVELADYPEVKPITLSLEVQINACKVDAMVNRDNIVISPFNPTFELPAEFDLKMPFYEPVPACRYTSDSVKYDLTLDSGGQVPRWISINSKRHHIEIFAEERDFEEIYGKEVSVKLKASLDHLFEDIQTFKIIFPDKPPEIEIPTPANDPSAL